MSQEGEESSADSTNGFLFDKLPNELKFKIISSIPEDDAETFCSLLRVSKSVRAICLAGSWKFIRNILGIYFFAKYTSVQTRIDDRECVSLGACCRKYLRIHTQLIYFMDILDEFRCMSSVNQCYENSITGELVETFSSVSCSNRLFQHQLDLLQAKAWKANMMVRKETLKGIKINNLMLQETDCDDESFLSVQAKSLIMVKTGIPCQITDQGLNQFIKAWLEGNNEIQTLDFHWDLSLRNINIVLDSLPLNPIWTPTDHENSLLKHISLDVIQERTQTHGMDHLYSIFNPGKINNYRLLIVGQSHLKLEGPPQTEAGLIRQYEELLLRG